MSILGRVVWVLTFVAVVAVPTLGVVFILVLATELSVTYLYAALGAGVLSVGGIVGYVRVLKRNDWLYRREIAHGLDAAFENPDVPERTFNFDTERLVVFSDQHKGTRDPADDFWRSERAYCSALAYYFRLGHHLIVLGDAEELWETSSPGKVIGNHDDEGMALTLEARFSNAGRYDRVWGNHDLNWMSPRSVAKYLGAGGPFGDGFMVKEALKLRVVLGDEFHGLLFLVHGHQGTADSQVITLFSRPFVRFFGFLQRRFKRGWNTPANDWELRERHDSAMFEWAKSRSGERIVLIAGHTHRPVFWNRARRLPTDQEIEQLAAPVQTAAEEQGADPQLAEQEADLEWSRAERRWGAGGAPPPQAMIPPCYFNTGCCSFADGDITGLEVDRGEIRLIRWPDDQGRARPKVLEPARARLSDVFDEVQEFAAGRQLE